MKAVDKREGGGAYNWGSVEDELKGAQDTANATGMVTQKMESFVEEDFSFHALQYHVSPSMSQNANNN